MAGNEYRDEHGHFTTEENNGGPCMHDSSSGNDIIYSDNLIKRSPQLSNNEAELIKKFNESANQEAIDILNDFDTLVIHRIKKGKTSYFKIRSDDIFLKDNVFDIKTPGESYYENGEIYFHESGHYVDSELSREISNGFLYASQTFLSPKYNMSLHDMVSKEKGKFSRRDGLKLSCLIDFKYLDKFNHGEDGKKLQDFFEKNLDSAIDFVYYRMELDDRQYNFISGKTDDMGVFRARVIKTLRNRADKAFGTDFTEKIDFGKSAVYGCQKYSIISDALTSRRDFTQTRLACIGHTASYYYNRHGYGLGSEFFANYFSAYARNDEEQMKATRQYMPKSCEIFDEMIQAYKNKKGVK